MGLLTPVKATEYDRARIKAFNTVKEDIGEEEECKEDFGKQERRKMPQNFINDNALEEEEEEEEEVEES